MIENTCPVNDAINRLDDLLSSGGVKNPKSRRITEDLLSILRDVAVGRAGKDHPAALEHQLDEFAGENGEAGADEVKRTVRDLIDLHGEVLISHVESGNCSTGACLRLAPAPCQMTCPAGIDIPTYLSLIGLGKDAEAIEVIRNDCPFPWVCGLVCTRPCEMMCVRGRIDSPVAIKPMKAFAAERSMSWGKYRNPIKKLENGRKICVIGGGPGGMSAAYYLALRGYAVTIIEAHPSPGGMLLLGIPRYRLPREVIDREAAKLTELGVIFRFNTRFGTDVTYDSLKSEGFGAFFFAIGAHKCFKLRIPGEDDFDNVLVAVNFLRRVALGDRTVPGKKALIIGGGNVAIDAARTCLRLGCEEVTIAYRRTRAEMPADVEEVEQAEEEGINLSFLTVPVTVKGTGKTAEGLHCLRAELVKQEDSDRMYPTPIEGSDYMIEADVIISAIGQRVDQDCMQSVPGLEWTRRTTISANMVSMSTSVPGVFAAGDAVTGPATVIEAIGGGKRAAEAIDRYLKGLPQPKMPPVPVRRGRVACMELPAATKMTLTRPEIPHLNIDRRRTTFQQVELGLSENLVREEARRCLRCDICLRCGRCVHVCRDKMGINALKMGYFDFDHPVETDFRATRENCILCGACAQNCPTGAMRIEDRNGERVLSLCGTVLNRQRLETCQNCGAVLGPARYLEFIRNRTDPHLPSVLGLKLCDACARRSKAAPSAGTMPV